MGQCHCKEEHSKEVDSLFRSEEEPPLTVTIVRGRGMRGANWFPGGIKERFLFCTVGKPGCDKPLFTTRRVKETLEPVWQEEADLPEYSLGSVLQFCVWDVAAAGVAELLGKATLQPEHFDMSGFNGELQLRQAFPSQKDRGLPEAYLAVKVRPAGLEYPESRAEEFSIMLDNSRKKALGVEFDSQDGSTLCVTSIKAGLIQAHNKRAHPAHQVELGDFIMQVNGIRGKVASLRERLQKDSRLELVIRRPALLEVALGVPEGLPDDSNGRTSFFGMELKEPSGNSLVILRVTKGGLLEEWNDSYPEQAVKSGDRIVGVDGRGGKADELLKKIKASERFHMSVIRPTRLEANPRKGSKSSPKVPPLPLHRLDTLD